MKCQTETISDRKYLLKTESQRCLNIRTHDIRGGRIYYCININPKKEGRGVRDVFDEIPEICKSNDCVNCPYFNNV